MKTLLIVLLTLVATGCQPSELEVDDGDIVNPEQQAESPITWTECGYEPGDHPCDFELMNQDGEMVSLYSLFGKPIAIDFSTMWCYYCQVAATEINQTATAYEADDLIYITILTQNFQGESPAQSDLDEWGTHFEIGKENTPILAGGMSMVDPTGETGWKVEAWPSFYFIDKEMVIAEQMRGWNSAMVQANIDQIIQ